MTHDPLTVFHDLIRCIRATLVQLAADGAPFGADAGTRTEAARMLDRLDAELEGRRLSVRHPPVIARFEAELQTAIRALTPDFPALGQALDAALPLLHATSDASQDYDPSSPLGPGFTDHNLDCELIGPDGQVLVAEDFRLGLFLLTPRAAYRDHRHTASEMYINLTGATSWRFAGEGEDRWMHLTAPSAVYNAPGRTHATLVHDEPFLVIYCWAENVQDKAEVLERADWQVLALAHRSAL